MNNLIAICCLFLVCYGCAGMPDRGTVPDDMTIRDIVSLYPAETSERQIQLSKAVLKSKSTGVFEVCELLGDTTADMRNRAEYALSGVVQNAAPEQYTVIEEALLEALFAALPNEQKIFLLEQLRICGSNAALKSLERLLDHPLLAESVLQTLESIGTVEAAELMFNALPRAGHDLKISVINRLGKLEYRAAAQEILNLAQNESVSIKMAAMQALAILGYTPAGDLLRDNLQNPAGMSVDRAEALYLKFLENKDGDDLKNIRLLDIFRDTTRQDNSRMHAAKIMLASGGSAVLPGIYAELTQASPAFRADVLRMMIPFRDPATANFWRSVLQTADPAEQVEIIRFLGWQGEAGSIKYIGPFLKAGEEPVRLEVMQALVKISPGIAAPLLMDHIDENLSEAEADVLFHAVMHIPADFLELNLPFVWDQGTTENRIFITHIIAGRYLPSMNSRLIGILTAGDNEIQMAVLEALSITGELKAFQAILIFGLRENEKTRKAGAAKTLEAIYSRQDNTADLENLLIDAFERSDPENRIWLMEILRHTNSQIILDRITGLIDDPDAKLREAAFRTLLEWQTPVAIDTLVEFSHRLPEQRQRILAFRAAYRLVHISETDTSRLRHYYQSLLSVAERASEKRLVIAGISEIRSVGAVQLIIPYLNDPELAEEAGTAVRKMMSGHDQVDFRNRLERLMPDLLTMESDFYPKAQDPPDGFQSLFNGIDLEGWRGPAGDPPELALLGEMEKFKRQIVADSLMLMHWTIQDGILCFDGMGESLCTRKDFRNFELLVDWKIEPGSDSGIYLRGIPQVQIWDIRDNPEGSGGLYNNKQSINKPLVPADNPAGEWNQFRIIMIDQKVTVYLNDQLVADGLRLENYWEPGTPVYSTGPIELQAHQTPVYFKNIFFRELPESGDAGWVDIFNGKDLTGWRIIGDHPESWTIEGGRLMADPDGSGWISSTRKYGDFELELDFKVPPGGNSGVFLRAPLRGDPAYSGIEVQILDDYAAEYADLKPWQYTGSVYDISAPEGRASRSAGEWQKINIRSVGPHLQVRLNGRKINDINLINYMHREPTHPGIKRRKGFIGFQNHGSAVEFKNIKIKELF